MKRSTAFIFTTLIVLVSVISYAYSWDHSRPLIIDHNYTDLNLIPADRIDSVKTNIKLHYAHTSHGSQLTTGIERIELVEPFYAFALSYLDLPSELNTLCILGGQVITVGVSADDYWRTVRGMNYTRDVLDMFPIINVSMWSWCVELNLFPEDEVLAYLDSISTLEAEYPNVTFVYMTGNAQVGGSSGLNRYLRNQMIRQYCMDNNKVLYDFADLDSWWYNPVSEEWEYSTYEYDGYIIPVEHPQFNGDDDGHTTFESCEQKGRALWWLLTRLEGGSEGDTLSVDESTWGEIKNLYR